MKEGINLMGNIHKFICKGDYFILDVSSGAIHVVDKIIYDILSDDGVESRNDVINKCREKYDKDVLNESRC
jgi:uncharacterized protein